ncbi:hypothetical protein, partial [Knoellia flava]|uniref:hypothetical protein n=1 Tax=Knoellia flava TaxID=913969 RepID=UPI001E52DFF0
LNSFSVGPKVVEPGDVLTVGYNASDDSGSLRCIIFHFTDPIDGSHQVRNDGALPLAATFTTQVPTSWPNGSYILSYVTLCDPTGNQTTYARDGRASKIPSNAVGP